MKLFDSHCHLEDRAYKNDFPDVLRRMKDNSVLFAAVVGISEKRSLLASELAAKHPELFATIGIHPHVSNECSEASLKRLAKKIDDENVIAWGEIGLDFNRMFTPAEIQEKWFIRQLQMAHELDLPVVLHERDSKGHFYNVLKRHLKQGQTGVVHCFGGTHEELCKYLDLGLHIGLTGIITQPDRGQNIRRLIDGIPLESILIETDSPYLTPFPEKKKNRRNEPAFVKSVFKKLVEIKSIDAAYLADQIWQNTLRFYKLQED